MTWDYDNDGLADLLAWGPDQVRFLRGNLRGEFQATDIQVDTRGKVSVCRSGDMDNDGDLDLVIATDEGVGIFYNQGGNKNHWIQVRLSGRSDSQGRSNSSGIGSLVALKSGPQYQAQVVRGRRTHFGLGKHIQPDVVRIIWTNGMTQNIIQPKPDNAYCEQMSGERAPAHWRTRAD
jgi:hypothetical protein